MGYIKNHAALALNDNRKVVLDLIETALASISPDELFKTTVVHSDNSLKVLDQTFDLSSYERIFLVGFGKGSAGICKRLEKLLGDKLTKGFDIDVVDETFEKISYTKGTHPLPSQTNIDFTENVLKNLEGVTEKDLILIVVCGGGSVLFEAPFSVDLQTLTKIVDIMLKSGANIAEMNVIRKHLSKVKGGGLAKLLYPATLANMLFSDVPGNTLSVIASGPTVKDVTTMRDVDNILDTYRVLTQTTIPNDAFTATVSDDKYFEHVHNLMVLSNNTALEAMEKRAKELGLKPVIFTDKLQGDAHELGEQLIVECKPGEVLLAGGESTVKVKGKGKGGRNQAVVLSALPFIKDDTILASFDSDGWDFYGYAGAIADKETLEKVKKQSIDPKQFLADDNSYGFFEKIGDGIDTGKLPSNVSDLYIVYKPIEKDSEDKNIGEKPRMHTVGPLSEEQVFHLEEKANEARELVIQTLLEAGSGHSAGPLGMADIFTAFYFYLLNHDPKNPDWPDRDRLILSNGHICPIRYVSMAQAGYFPVEELKTLRKINSRLQGHPHRTALPGVETTSGPLGEGISQAIGIALAGKLDKKKYHTYVIASDGELQEGNSWEAVMFAGKLKLNNLMLVVDRNNIQIDGFTEDVMPLEPLRAKFESFNWYVIDVDGNNVRTFVDAVLEGQAIQEKPTVIIAHTVPGKGIDFMENDYTWHGKPPSKDEAVKALKELRTLGGKIESEHLS